MPHKSLLRFAFAALLLCLSARQAAAQLGTGGTTGLLGTGGTGTGGSGTTFTTSDFFVGIQQIQGVNLSTFDAARFFDVARCECNTLVSLFIALQASGFAKRSTALAGTGNTGVISIWLGTGCDDPNTQRLGGCREIDHEPLLTFLNQGSWTINTNAQSLSSYLGNFVTDAGVVSNGGTAACSAPTGTFSQVVNVVLDTDGNGYSDLTIPYSAYVDLDPPPAPANVSVQGGDQALIVKWDQVDQSLYTDLIGYQLLCSRADKYMVFDQKEDNDAGTISGPFSPGFEMCKQTDGGLEIQNPTFICSGLLSPVATSYRIEGLQNEIYYSVAVVSVDNSGNPSSSPPVLYGKPVKTLSFYDVYRDGYSNSNGAGGSPDPGKASGGFCAVAAQPSPWRSTEGALAGIGLVVAGVTLALRRRRDRR